MHKEESDIRHNTIYSHSPHNGRPVLETAKSFFHTPDDSNARSPIPNSLSGIGNMSGMGNSQKFVSNTGWLPYQSCFLYWTKLLAVFHTGQLYLFVYENESNLFQANTINVFNYCFIFLSSGYWLKLSFNWWKRIFRLLIKINLFQLVCFRCWYEMSKSRLLNAQLSKHDCRKLDYRTA